MKKILFCFLLLLLIIFPLLAFAQPQPGGACCYNNNTQCEDVSSEVSCEEAPTGDGIFHAGVSCRENPCRPTVPTMDEWGIIIFIVLAGLGAVFYLRKNKRAQH